MPWGYAAVAAATLGAGYMSSQAAKDAANQQSDAANQANQLQWNMYQQNRTDNMPSLDARNMALTQLQGLYGPNGSFLKGLDPAAVQAEPGYQFGMDQGQQALDRQAAAAGRLYSGAQLKAASEFGDNYASQHYNDAFNRLQLMRASQTNALQSMAGLGQSAANTITGAGQGTAGQMGQNLMGAANAQGAAGIAGANAWGNAMNSLAGWGMNHNWGTPSGGSTGWGSTDGYNWGGTGSNYDFSGESWNQSDVRLKTDIARIGTTPRGYTEYVWMWRASGERGRGVIAQEVAQRDPSAVRVGDDGYLQVDYSKV